MPNPTLSRYSRDEGYPSSTEEKVPNIQWHGVLLRLLLQMLEWHFRASPRVVVNGDMFLYHERGSKECVGPDLFISMNAERRLRRQWRTWADGAVDLVIELLSESSVEDDQDDKLVHYRDVLKVREYFLFDPEGHLMSPRLRGFRRIGEAYAPIEPVNGRLPSEVMGLHLEQSGDALRLWDPATNAWVPTDAERAEQQAARAAEAEERVRELEAELARRGGTP
jgi:Uma2 family endonuclease